QNDVTLKMPAFEWVHVQLHQQKGMISLSPPTICNSAFFCPAELHGLFEYLGFHRLFAQKALEFANLLIGGSEF
ncbi:hypothetical protein, partial [Klebsiella quasipneumoniae]|uniref:hypothetical protein n=1 Tax=Klebsiella quasipneumoniae TaxID=1463165 RepID=UPI003006E6B0